MEPTAAAESKGRVVKGKWEDLVKEICNGKKVGGLESSSEAGE